MPRFSPFFHKRITVLLFLLVGFAALFIGLNLKIAGDDTLPEVANIQTMAEPAATPVLGNLENPAAQSQPTDNQAAMTPDQNGQLVIKQRPEWRLAGTLHQHLPALKKSADSGDVEAAYILAMNLRFCVVVPVTEAELQQRLQQAHLYQDDGVAVVQLSESYDVCAGVDGAQRQQFYQYLAAAAARSYVPAQEMLGQLVPEFYMKLTGASDLSRDAYIKTRDAFIQQQFAALESASLQGSLNALIKLSQMHHSQNYSQTYSQKDRENGRMHAYAMNQLILELAQDNELQSKYAWFQQKALTELTPEEIDRALAISQQWLDIIKANGTLYLQSSQQ